MSASRKLQVLRTEAPASRRKPVRASKVNSALESIPELHGQHEQTGLASYERLLRACRAVLAYDLPPKLAKRLADKHPELATALVLCYDAADEAEGDR